MSLGNKGNANDATGWIQLFIACLSKPVGHMTLRVNLKADSDVYVGSSVHEVRCALAEDTDGRGLSVPGWREAEAGNFLLNFFLTLKLRPSQVIFKCMFYVFPKILLIFTPARKSCTILKKQFCFYRV